MILVRSSNWLTFFSNDVRFEHAPKTAYFKFFAETPLVGDLVNFCEIHVQLCEVIRAEEIINVAVGL